MHLSPDSPENELQRAARTFEELGWLFPAYYQIGHLRRLARALEQEPSLEAKHLLLETSLKNMYEPSNIAAMQLERYNKAPHISEFKEVISDSIEAFHLGLTYAAIASLIPVIEGILRKVAQNLSKPFKGNIFANLLATIDALINKEKFSIPEIKDERIMMLMGFRKIVAEHLFVSTKNYSGHGRLNRNGILHGIYNPTEYGYESNFYKLISVIDIICFFISLRSPDVSALAPDTTEATEQLANYYRELRALAQRRNVYFKDKNLRSIKS
jgi:hypothetical protein